LREQEPRSSLANDRPAISAELLDGAFNNMPHGVVMFDEDGRILVCNRRYIEMYSLSPEIVRPGCTLRALIEHRKETGLFAGDVEQYCADIMSLIKRGETASQEIVTTDGRSIHIVNQPIPSGGWVVTHEDVTRHKVAEAQIAHMAHHDALTDLPNRSLFRAQLDQALRMTARGGQLAVLFIDLDNFKGINDTLGHHVGDELLKTVATRLRSCVRETDIVARLGGDEFVIVQTMIEQPSDVAALASRLRETIMVPCDLAEHHLVVDTSIGIALSPHDGTAADQLVKHADMALYGAKASGRGTYRFFEHDMDVRMMERRKLELELRQALLNGEFEVHYQPLINLEHSSVTSCEALLRWRHPVRGIVSPGGFIALAEEIGLITRIGEWVLRTACAEAARWPDAVSLSVNVSPAQFRKQNIVQVVTQALASSGLAAHRLEIEITETILMQNTEETLATLHQLRALGVHIAMDDFGTGYSSLSYLQKFPFDKIKIDQSFINGLSEKDETTAIVRAVTGLASSFHMTTTAEGVETAEQREIVTSLGCTEMQGFLFSAARPADELAQFFDRDRVVHIAAV
jgi:diguanylate cyclase (GGDEF)-like protein